jgi:DNA invertase Pin-like site-specific DNA recombinase
MMLGYARVSTSEQDTALQIDALTRAGCDRILQDEGVSGATESRPALSRVLRMLKPGDTLVTWKLDRLGRSLSHLIAIVAQLEQRGVGFRSLSDAIDTGSAGGRLMFHILGALAEFERSLIAERTRAGLAVARSRGRRLGRPPKLSYAQARAAERLLLQGGLIGDVAATYAVSPLTLKRSMQRLRNVMNFGART